MRWLLETHARARAERVQSGREGWLVGVYLFERSKNYRSGAASRRCLSFDREATMREFARYLPRETSKPLGSAPLRSVSCEWARRHSVPAWTANALTHFSQATPFLPHLVLSFFLSFLVCYSLCVSLFPLFDPTHQLASCPLFVSPLHRISFSRHGSLHSSSCSRSTLWPPFCQAHTSNISCRGPRSGPLPSSCRTNACNCS